VEIKAVRMVYSPAQANTPLVNHLIREFNDLTVNILRAEVTTHGGWLEASLEGTPTVIENAMAWLQDRGVEIQPLDA
jgi:ABC-type methionine transport system ATPase subunit